MKLSHVDAEGRARMVDVGDKPLSDRTAVATGAVRMSREAYDLVAGQAIAKGDVLAVAEVAGVMAAKRTGELIPLCHPLGLDHVQVDVALAPELPGVRVTATTRVTGRTEPRSTCIHCGSLHADDQRVPMLPSTALAGA